MVVPVVGKDRRLVAALVLVGVFARVSLARADEKACVRVVDDLARVRAGERVACPAGDDATRPVSLAALRDEVIAFQVIVQAGDAPLQGVRVDVELGGPGVRVERFVEHYVLVAERSRSREPAESLGWLPAARPDDASVLGDMPDALIPVEHAPEGRPYPVDVPARRNAAVWVDVTVADYARAGRYDGWLTVSGGGIDTRVPIVLDVAEARLPYRAVSVLAGYDGDALDARLEPDAKAQPTRQLWQLLHAHGVDALVGFVKPEQVTPVAGALDGSWFDDAAGYVGPGARVPVAAVTLGAYGALGDPEPGKRALVASLAAAVPETVADVFLYAMDEDCRSPRGPGWRRLLLEGSPMPRPVLVAHSCSEPPAGQDVDLVLTVAEAWNARQVAEAREHGRRVWVYNGKLPRAPTLLLDAPPSAAAAFGWIAATHEIDRWFLWAVNFWNDDNRGGQGAIDPFVTVASFHNKDGDVALLDGLYVYPGTQRPPFAAHSVGVPGVLPSMRLKRLRRGLEDAGYLALVAASNVDAAARIAEAALPRALDEVSAGERRAWSDDGAAFTQAREQLRALVPAGASLDEKAARAALRALAERRLLPAATIAGVHGDNDGHVRLLVIAGFAVFALLVVAAFVRVARRVNRS